MYHSCRGTFNLRNDHIVPSSNGAIASQSAGPVRRCSYSTHGDAVGLLRGGASRELLFADGHAVDAEAAGAPDVAPRRRGMCARMVAPQSSLEFGPGGEPNDLTISAM